MLNNTADTIRNVLKKELIGLEAEVTRSRNPSDVGMCGRIVDETKNTVVLTTKTGKKTLIKNNLVLKVHYEGNVLEIQGSLIVMHPHERIKMRFSNQA